MRRLLMIALIVNFLALAMALWVAVDRLGILDGVHASIDKGGMVDVIIENRSPELVHVTPLGTGDSGRLLPLPLYDGGDPRSPSRDRARFPVAPGGRLRLHYVWWDHRHSLVVVDDPAGGAPRQLTGAPPTPNLVRSPTRAADFVVTDPRQLPPVTPDVRAAYDRAVVPYVRRRASDLWLLAIPSFALLCLIAMRSRPRRAAAMTR